MRRVERCCATDHGSQYRLLHVAVAHRLLADAVFPDVPLRQCFISFPFPLRYLFAAHPQAMGKVLGIVYLAISTQFDRLGLELIGISLACSL